MFHQNVLSTADNRDRIVSLALAALVLLAYAWFFQGEGWNQHAHFATIRALVENGTSEITPFASSTGDISRVGGRVYSNKPPGLAIVCVPFYFVLYHAERFAGIDPTGSAAVVRANMHATTVWGSALPGATLAVGLLVWFRRTGMRSSSALWLAFSFALGSLVWAYSGALVAQVSVAAALFGAFLLVTRPPVTAQRAVLAGVLVGFAGVADYFAAPLTGAFVVYLMMRRAAWRATLAFAIGPLAWGGFALAYNRLVFGSFLATTYDFMDPYFKRDGLFLGQFHAPEWSRLYWITYHRMRGLLVCSPAFAIPLLSILALAVRGRRGCFTAPATTTAWQDHALALWIVGHFTLLILTFVGWTGGWGVGPRYLVPALPFLWIFARRGFERFPVVSAVFIALSIATMLAVTSVQVFYPANDSGPPTHWDPVSAAWLGLVRGQLARTPDSYNLGMSVGLRGVWSLMPLLLIMIVGFALVRHYLRQARGESVSAATASGSTTDAHRAYISPEG